MNDSERSAALDGVIASLRRFGTDASEAATSVSNSPLASTGLGDVLHHCAEVTRDAIDGLTLEPASLKRAIAALEATSGEIDEAGITLEDTLARSIKTLANLVADIESSATPG